MLCTCKLSHKLACVGLGNAAHGSVGWEHVNYIVQCTKMHYDVSEQKYFVITPTVHVYFVLTPTVHVYFTLTSTLGVLLVCC